MGVLDDAIREHLELKRRHGASDEEIAQEEAEALGPARRDFPAQAATAGAGTDEQSEGDAEVVEAPEVPVEQAAVEAPTIEPPPVEPPPVEPPPIEEPPVEPEPEPEPESEPETRNSNLETSDSDDDDVLEETPEFLQDAPEHDRLWFEQKPPRDFDFE